jgi:hypothetical protein
MSAQIESILGQAFCISYERALNLWYIFVGVRIVGFEELLKYASSPNLQTRTVLSGQPSDKISDCDDTHFRQGRQLITNPTSIEAAEMFRLGVRSFATTVRRAAETVAQMEESIQYGIKVSKAQGVVKGLTGGI